jgi:hypothetical protein
MEMKTHWQPRRILRFIDHFNTSTGTILVDTDQGEAYIKVLGNPAGPHVLACEWVGTSLARWIGLSTFDFAIINVLPENELPLYRGGYAEPGPAFATRKEAGTVWSGFEDDLRKIENQNDLTKLVLLDTWLLNCDRYPPNDMQRRPNYDNVFLSEEGASPHRFILKAIDHTHCFNNGHDLTARMSSIDRIRDYRIYGLFPALEPFMKRGVMKQTVKKLAGIDVGIVSSIIDKLPNTWAVGRSAGIALSRLVCERAKFIEENIMSTIWPQQELDFEAGL